MSLANLHSSRIFIQLFFTFRCTIHLLQTIILLAGKAKLMVIFNRGAVRTILGRRNKSSSDELVVLIPS